MDATFCCVQCRLLQPPTTTCAECAAPMTAPVELVRELLQYRDMQIGNHRDWGMVTAFLAGSSLAMPALAPLAIGSIVALGLQTLRARRRRQRIVGVQLPPVATAAGATTVYGVPRRFRATVASILDQGPVLVEHAVVRDPRGAVLLRRSEGAPFLLEQEDGTTVLVTGVARVTSALARRAPLARGDVRLNRMGVPVDLAAALAARGHLEVASVAADGAVLAVTGRVEEEAVAELAFHRDAGRIPVMRGTPTNPVLLAEPRLIAAALP